MFNVKSFLSPKGILSFAYLFQGQSGAPGFPGLDGRPVGSSFYVCTHNQFHKSRKFVDQDVDYFYYIMGIMLSCSIIGRELWKEMGEKEKKRDFI